MNAETTAYFGTQQGEVLLTVQLLKHIEENPEGSKLEELCQVLPALSVSQVQSLVRTLQRQGSAHSEGRTNQGRWYPGPDPEDPTVIDAM